MIKIWLIIASVWFTGFMDADARKKGIGFIGVGEDVSETMELPKDAYNNYNLGYYYYSFRLMFIPVITWDKKYVLVQGDYYVELPEEELAAIKKEHGSLLFKGNLWVKCVNWLWLILIISYPFYRSWKNKRDRKMREKYFLFAHKM